MVEKWSTHEEEGEKGEKDIDTVTDFLKEKEKKKKNISKA